MQGFKYVFQLICSCLQLADIFEQLYGRCNILFPFIPIFPSSTYKKFMNYVCFYADDAERDVSIRYPLDIFPRHVQVARRLGVDIKIFDYPRPVLAAPDLRNQEFDFELAANIFCITVDGGDDYLETNIFQYMRYIDYFGEFLSLRDEKIYVGCNKRRDFVAIRIGTPVHVQAPASDKDQ